MDLELNVLLISRPLTFLTKEAIFIEMARTI